MIYRNNLFNYVKGEKFRRSLIERYFCSRPSGIGSDLLARSDRILNVTEQKAHRLQEMQCRFDSLGASDLFIDMLMKNDDLSEKLFKEAILLGIGLLEAGNSQVQVKKNLKNKSINKFLEFLCIYF